MTAAEFLALDLVQRTDALERLNAIELRRLLDGLREAREAGTRVEKLVIGEVWRAWYTHEVRAGRDPSALRTSSADPVERFFAHTVPGLDGCVIWDGPPVFTYRDADGRGRQATPQRWAWRHAGRDIPIGSAYRVLAMCAAPSCVNVDHLALVRADRRSYSEERLIGAIQALALRLGHTPTTREWIEAGWKPTPEVARTRWGSWVGYCRAAGLEPPRTASRVGRKYDSEASMLADLARWAAEQGFAPTEDEWNASGWKPSGTTFRRRFKSWGRAREAAGLPRRSHVLADHPLRKYARGLRLTRQGSYLADESLDDVQARLYAEARAS